MKSTLQRHCRLSLSTLLVVAFSVLTVFLCGFNADAQSYLTWKCSTPSAQWVDEPTVALTSSIPLSVATAAPYARIIISSATTGLFTTGQLIKGWGGCFNERGWEAILTLSSTAQAAVMTALFDPATGLKLNYGRTPIGSNDYSITPYSYDETQDDYALTNFSIAEDGNYLIPYIKAALAIRPDIYMWAVPWSPPSWMKSNDSLINGGSILSDTNTMTSLATYFVDYLNAYSAQGINISMVMPQNEPNVSNNYPTCAWTSTELSQFIGYYLGPAIANAGLGTRIFLGTLNDSGGNGTLNQAGYSYWVAPSMQDPVTSTYISGVACQWSANVDMAGAQVVLPSLERMQSELECGNTNSNDWAFGQFQYEQALEWFGAGANSDIIWNLVLDQTGLSNGGWAQCSPIVVDTQTGVVTYTPYYYLFKHFSYFVQPGAHVASTYSSNWGDRIAFVNPDGSLVAVIQNSATSSYTVTLNFNGLQSGVVTLPADSFNTFVLPGPGTSITSPLSASAIDGVGFTYQITGSNAPSLFTATGLPPGLAINRATGLISGTASTTGTAPVTVTASNSGGTASGTLNVALLPPLPAITSATSVTTTVGQPFQYTITASGNAFGFGATGLPAGLSVNSASGLISGTTLTSGTAFVTLSATNGSGTSNAELTIVINSTPYSRWQSSVFSAAQLANTSISGATADPAGDGISNLMKYALNLNPMVNSVGGLPTGSVIKSGSGSYLALTYNQVLSATDITYTVQVSTDLMSWHSGAGYTSTPVVGSSNGVTESVTVQSLTPLSGKPSQFIRLQVTKP